ncbi:endonuclease III [Tepidamorphus sp. 3E244]|uniref:endonuclease III n=1 Tax=Tepidamorphus sp. 3E244 TaxID=3385498 RepID=UPI0038FC707C
MTQRQPAKPKPIAAARKPSTRRKRATKLKRDAILSMFSKLKASNPEPETELEYTDPYTLVVAVALSAQATDTGVNKATRVLFADADTPQKMVDLGEDGIRERIKSLGLFRNKAKNVLALSQMILADFGGEVPQTREELELLPGVGRKTANVVLNTAFGQPTIAVDTHIFRVSNRTGLAPGKDVREVEDNLERVVPDAFKRDAHHWLILHGRYICKARKPACNRCVIREECLFKDKTA